MFWKSAAMQAGFKCQKKMFNVHVPEKEGGKIEQHSKSICSRVVYE